MDKRLYVELPPFTGRNVPITEIAKAIGKDAHYVRIGIQQGILKFGVAMKMGDAPKTLEEEWKAEFIEACQQTEKINYYLDLLVFGELQDRIEFLLDSGKDVKRIEERMEEYRRNNKEQTGRSIESERNEL